MIKHLDEGDYVRKATFGSIFASAETNTTFVYVCVFEYSLVKQTNSRIVGGDMYFRHNDGMCTA